MSVRWWARRMATSTVRQCPRYARLPITRLEWYRATPVWRFLWKPHTSCGEADFFECEMMTPVQTSVLAINGGSSSIKFVLYQTGEPLERRLYGKIDRIGLPGTNLTFKDPTGNRQDSRGIAASDHKSAANSLIDWLEEQNSFASVRAVGHRVAHGMQHTAPKLVTQELLA